MCSSIASTPSLAPASSWAGSGSRNRLTTIPAPLRRRTASATFKLRTNDIEAALGRHFFAAFGNERRLVRRRFARDGEHFVGTGQFQVDWNGDRLLQNAKVALLNMPAIFAEMDRDRIGAAQLGQRRRPDGIGLVCFAGLADGGHVIDVYAEDCHSLPLLIISGNAAAYQAAPVA